MLRRVLRVWIWSAGLSYLATIALIVWFATDGALIRNDPDCRPLSIAMVVYWLCDDAPLWQQFMVNALNIGLTTTVWLPVFVASALAAPELAPVAATLVLSNLIGVPAALFVLMRSGQMLFGAARALLTEGRAAG